MKYILNTIAVTMTALTLNAQELLKVGKSYTEIPMEVEINAPIEKVWKELANIGDIYLNSPTVSKSFVSSEAKQGIGATRHMEMSIKEGATLDEKVVKWEEGTYMALENYKIYKVSGIQTMGGDFLLIAKGDKTILRSTLHYSMTNALYGMMNKIMAKKKFAKLWKTVLAGYKKHIETGEHVTVASTLETNKVIQL